MIPETCWLQPVLIEDRIDAGFYSAEHLAMEETIRRCHYGATRLGSRLSRVFKGAFYVLSSEYRGEGIPFLRVTDITKGYIDTTTSAYLSPDVHAREKKTAVAPGFLLFAKGGSIGNCAVVPDRLRSANISQDLIGALPTSDLDAYFAVAFLTSTFGVSQMIRWAQGNVHPHITNEAVRSLLIPIPPMPLQVAIGNKLRKAERLRERAVHAQTTAHLTIDEMFGPDDWVTAKPFGWTQPGRLEDSRIDAWFNQPAFLRMVECLRDRATLGPVSQFARLSFDSADLRSRHTPYFDYYEIADLDSNSGLITSTRVAIMDAPSRAKFAVTPGDILVSTVRPNRKGIAIVPENSAAAVCSSGFSILRAPDLETAYYLRACLMHDIATHQLMRWNTGATYPAIERSVPLSVLIPNPGVEQVHRLGSQFRACAGDFSEARDLTERANCDIEALIRSTLDETALLIESEEAEVWLKQQQLPENQWRN